MKYQIKDIHRGQKRIETERYTAGLQPPGTGTPAGRQASHQHYQRALV